MPRLNVASVLDSPFFSEAFSVIRQASTVDTKGRQSVTTTTFQTQGVITKDGEYMLRNAIGETTNEVITIHTRFKLTDETTGYAPDIISWSGRQFTVKKVADWSHYGEGFVMALAESLGMAGRPI